MQLKDKPLVRPTAKFGNSSRWEVHGNLVGSDRWMVNLSFLVTQMLAGSLHGSLAGEADVHMALHAGCQALNVGHQAGRASGHCSDEPTISSALLCASCLAAEY